MEYIHVVDRRTQFFAMSAAERKLETIKDKVCACTVFACNMHAYDPWNTLLKGEIQTRDSAQYIGILLPTNRKTKVRHTFSHTLAFRGQSNIDSTRAFFVTGSGRRMYCRFRVYDKVSRNAWGRSRAANTKLHRMKWFCDGPVYRCWNITKIYMYMLCTSFTWSPLSVNDNFFYTTLPQIYYTPAREGTM